MTATENVRQVPQSHNSSAELIVPRHGVVTLFGYGIQVRVDRGHLLLEDGIGPDRRYARLPRVDHGLKRLVVIGSDGCMSLAALRWLSDQDVAFTMLERDGKVLAVTGPVRPSDARLRRAQALAHSSGAALCIARELISQKLAGQEQVARGKLDHAAVGQQIADYRLALAEAETIDTIRSLESQGAAAYWAAWHDVQVLFPKKDLPRVPDHWRTFGTRKSPLSGSPRLAATPANAMLNYLYALLESEARLAAAALGLDPGLGFIHVDTPARDSLACDLMEPIRAKVDAYVLDWIMQQPLRREWFFEQRDGNCRLMGSFAVRLSETTPLWARAVAPFAEWTARQLWRRRQSAQNIAPSTRLTQTHRREARVAVRLQTDLKAPRLLNLCRGCGKTIRDGRSHCAQCAVGGATERLLDAARLGREAAHSPEARAKRANRQREHARARSSWTAKSLPAWLTPEVFSENIQPLLERMSNSAIAAAIGVSRWYAGRIRAGRRRPHPRHWSILAKLVNISVGVSD